MPKKSRANRFYDAYHVLNDATREIELVKEELEDWKYKLEGTNLENTNKYSELEDAVENLVKGWDHLDKAIGHLDEVEIPGGVNK